MREILFKAKRMDNGEWVEGYIVRSRENTYPNGFEMITKEGINYDELDYFNPNFISYEVDESTICQYTGLTDKNGKKIWENDIVYIPYIRLEDSYCRVIFRRGQFIGEMADGCEDNILNSRAEVIGNIFDNAELLKG